jgi:hypothetical protein
LFRESVIGSKPECSIWSPFGDVPVKMSKRHFGQHRASAASSTNEPTIWNNTGKTRYKGWVDTSNALVNINAPDILSGVAKRGRETWKI